MNPRRQEYNTRQAEVRKAERDRIRAFRAAHPERFAELVTQTQAESVIPDRRMSIHEAITDKQRQEAEQRVDATILRFRAGRQDYFITAKDTWGDEHHLFLTLSKQPEPGDKVHTPVKKTEYTVVEAVPCTCPLCQ